MKSPHTEWINRTIENGMPGPLNVGLPPCPNCKHWNPQLSVAHIGEGLIFDRFIMLCHAETMFHDFSCHEPKEKAPG